jgi:hypothetical protein
MQKIREPLYLYCCREAENKTEKERKKGRTGVLEKEKKEEKERKKEREKREEKERKKESWWPVASVANGP